MTPSIAAALSSLEGSTERLVAADPEDFPAVEAALLQRGEDLTQLREVWDDDVLAETPGIGERLRGVLDGGAEVSRKLRLVRAAAQADLARSRREAFVLSSLLAPARQTRIDFFG